MLRHIEFFTEPNHSGAVLLTTCLKAYGTQCLEWEPLALELEVLDDLQLSRDTLDPGAFDRLHAAATAITTDQFYTYLEAFECITKALCFQPPLFDALTPCAPEEMSTAVWEVQEIDEDFSENRFSGEVTAYIREALRFYGYYKSPPNLQFAGYEKFYDSSWVLDHPELGKEGRATNAEQQRKVGLYLQTKKQQLELDIKKLNPKRILL